MFIKVNKIKPWYTENISSMACFHFSLLSMHESAPFTVSIFLGRSSVSCFNWKKCQNSND